MPLLRSIVSSSSSSSSLMLVRPFRVRLSVLDLPGCSSSNTNETSMFSVSRRLSAHSTVPLNPSALRNESTARTDHDDADREIINRFVNAKNDVEARQVLTEMWKQSRFCDLILVIDGSEYLTHRIVLAASSVKYRSIFRERRSDFVSRTHLRHSSHKGLQLLLTFLYTGQVTFTWRNLHEILNCAKELHVTQIFDISEQFLLTFDKRHVFRVLDLSRRYGLRKAFYHCHDYLCRHFTQAIEMKSFLQVPYSTVVNLLSDESMRNRDETVLLTRLLNWIISNHHDNQQNLLNLFVNIRWNQFDYSEQREWLTAAQQLTDNPKLIALINQQMTLAYEQSKRRSTSIVQRIETNVTLNDPNDRHRQKS